MKLVALLDDTKYPAGMALARNFLGMVALLCCAITLSAPSSARSLHMVDHVSAPVAVGEFHSHDDTDHHDDGNDVDQDAPKAPNDGDQGKSGHSHMPTSVSDLSHLAEPQLVTRHSISDGSHAAADLPSLTNRGWSPPVRPPRTA